MAEPTPNEERTRPLVGAKRDSVMSAEFVSRILERLGARRAAFERYAPLNRISGGGQGEVLRVRDHDLLRDLAMKVVRADRADPSSDVATRSLGRFLEEAQVTGQLDHPGIVPVHELGVNPGGRAYFTMKLVRGSTLREVIERMHAGSEEWTRERVLGAILKVCEALAYAHDKRVIHRDLKPSNVMLGRYGEVFVMDWGLARVLDFEDTRDLRIQPDAPSSEVHTALRDANGDSSDSPLRTMDGDVVGTPSYMSPEQARGEIASMGPQSDVYSIGTLLYRLLTNCDPYVMRGESPSNFAIWKLVREGPPARVLDLAPDAPPEVVAICEKAMARSCAERYPSARALEDDLRAYLEGRVVSAHRTGAIVELKKWVRRNTGFAIAIAVAVLAVVVGASWIAYEKSQAARIASAAEADTRLALDVQFGAELIRRAETDLWHIHPDTLELFDDWIAAAEEFLSRAAARDPAAAQDDGEFPVDERLVRRLEAFRERRARIEAELDEGTLAEDERETRLVVLEVVTGVIPFLEEHLARLKRRPTELERPRFMSDEAGDRATRLAAVRRAAGALRGGGLLDEVRNRRRLASELEQRSVAEHAQAWTEALATIAARDGPYRGLEMPPQLGLVPLGRNDSSGLQEFWHVLSGERPQPDGFGGYDVARETGMVFVLVPGGAVEIGAQSARPDAPHYDSLAKESEGPPTQVELAPYFLSKYEMTLAQWYRATWELPSSFPVGYEKRGDRPITFANPVESVSWLDCDRVLARWDLSIPTEAQWEFGARGGSDARYWWGDEAEPARTLCNTVAGATDLTEDPGPDGRFLPWPVGSTEPNGYGLYDVLGNVEEWCLDWHVGRLSDADGVAPETGEFLSKFSNRKTRRGGGWLSGVDDVRIASRFSESSKFAGQTVGVRPARRLEFSDPDPSKR